MSSSSKRKAAFIVLILLLCLCWWWEAWNFSDRRVPGKYVAESATGRNVVVMKQDHTFEQEITAVDGRSNHVTGSWRRFGEAGVAFSNNFLAAPATAKSKDNVYGMLDNTFGFWTLTLEPQAAPIKFHKKLFR